MRTQLLSVLLLSCLCLRFEPASAQTDNWFRYQFPEKTPAAYSVPLKPKYESLLKANSNSKIKQRDSERFAAELAYATKRELSMGNIYFGLIEMEDYLNAVLKQVAPDSVKNNPNLRVYVSRTADENAGILPDGTVLFNMGQLPNLKDEATLAYLLGHELSHYLMRHGRNQYMVSLKSQTKLNRLLPFAQLLLNVKEMEYSRNQETEADSLGAILAYNAGYNPQGMLNLTTSMLEMDKYYDLQNKETFEVSLKSRGSHPATLLRHQNASIFLKKGNAAGKQNYVVSQQKFEQLKVMARQEKLNLMAAQNELLSVVSNAYLEYLANPENPTVLMLLVEGIRKKVYTFPEVADRGFLTAHMQHNYFAKKEGITKNLNFLIPDSAMVSAVYAKSPGLKNAPYQTYSEAFNYFAGQAETKMLTEVFLSRALFETKNETLRNQHLNRYLAAGNARFPEYAQALLKNDLNLPATSRKLILVDDIAYTQDFFYGYRSNWIQGEQKQQFQQPLIKEHFQNKKDNHEIHFATSYFDNQTPEAAALIDMFSILENLDLNTAADFQISRYEPAYWQYFKDHNISQVQFYRINALDKTYKKYRHFFAIPPFTAFYLVRTLLGAAYKAPNNRYAFAIGSATINLSDKQRNVTGYYLEKKVRLTDKRLASQLYAISKETEKELKKKKNYGPLVIKL